MDSRQWIQFVIGMILGLFVTSLITGALNLSHVLKLSSVMPANSDIMRRNLIRLKDFDTVFSQLQVNTSRTERPVRVMVMVLTARKNWEKVEAVRRTWGKRVKLIFITSKSNNETVLDNAIKPDNDTLELDVPEGRDYLSEKSFGGFRYLYENHLDDADWFMKADDDTYVIVENLRHFLSLQNSSEPLYFGQTFMKYIKQGYNSGGAGYVLSKEALYRMHTDISREKVCKKITTMEDVDIGKCMAALGVQIKDTVDSEGRNRFHAFPPPRHLFGPYPSWYLQFDKYKRRAGLDAISKSAISFHYMKPRVMDEFEFYLYRLRVHGECGRDMS